ncbi:hypothetical protein QBC33DRAFT_519135 [Phialemonium atrogriseum]|uniref:Uncharacterized protein n=1 Tax=Phialemonium atrogriseum TaxID=1093897 RepID=A0AAJ0BTP3_9PEZI|nr:uncharacterized protein QBC33DRAFT_519135 [Phialemonium atrogriseum]KAK1762934.1 hypothetical protein QBC33DRAFT_519135 [Phialemonium atrogriseum]
MVKPQTLRASASKSSVVCEWAIAVQVCVSTAVVLIAGLSLGAIMTLKEKTEPAKGKKAAAAKKVTFAAGPEVEAGSSTNGPVPSPIGDVITVCASGLETDSGTPI